MDANEAVGRIREACKGKTPVNRYVMKKIRPNDEREQRVHECNYVSLIAADLVAACECCKPDAITDALKNGAQAGNMSRVVTIQMSDAFHLLECCKGG